MQWSLTMTLHGTLIELPQGKIGFECRSSDWAKPKIIVHVWEIVDWCGCYVDIKDVIDKPATLQDGRVFCDMENGSYFEGTLEHCGQTKAISVEVIDAERPKVRSGVKIRWRDGCWEKYLKRDGGVRA
jgi:hypothetical protein